MLTDKFRRKLINRLTSTLRKDAEIALGEFVHVLKKGVAADDRTDGNGNELAFRLGMESQTVKDLRFTGKIAVIQSLTAEVVNDALGWKGNTLTLKIQIGLIVHHGLNGVHVMASDDLIVAAVFENQ